jgi:hypothetical protein
MQLGKLDVSKASQELGCKTPDYRTQHHQWLRSAKQNFSAVSEQRRVT